MAKTIKFWPKNKAPRAWWQSFPPNLWGIEAESGGVDTESGGVDTESAANPRGMEGESPPGWGRGGRV